MILRQFKCICLTLSFIITLVACNEQKSSTMKKEKLNLPLNKVNSYTPAEDCLNIGDYFAIEYISSLKKTLSPIKTEKVIKLPAYFARIHHRDNEGQYQSSIGNSYDATTFIISGDCKKSICAKTYCPVTLVKANLSKFILNYKGKKIQFQYIGNIRDWLASILFAGRWIDEKKREFNFQDNGFALIDGRYEKYLITRSPIEESAFIEDEIHIGDKRYIFVFENNITVYLYKFPSTETYDLTKLPKIVLKKIVDAKK